MNYEMRRNGDVVSGVGAGSPRCLSIVDWRTPGMLSGMLGKRKGEGGCGGIKGVVTGDETAPTRELRVLGFTLLYISFSARDAARRLSQRSRRSQETEMLSEVILLPRINLTIDVDLIAIRNR